MLLTGAGLVVTGAFLILPHIQIDSFVDFVNLHLLPFLWALVLLCAGLAIIHSYINADTVKVWIMSIIFSIIALAMVHVIERMLIQHSVEQQKVTIANKSTTILGYIQGTIAADLLLAKTMVNSLKASDYRLSQENFSQVAETIMATSPRISHIALAEDLVVSHVYPMMGNEKAIGLNYRMDPQQLPSVQKALDENEVILAGPVNLIQGGTALIGRIPIPMFEDASGNNDFWGIMSIIIDTEMMLAPLSKSNTQLQVSVRGRDGLGQYGGVFYGQASTFDDHPLLYDIELPSGNWQVAVTPISGWYEKAPHIIELRVAIFLIWLMMIIFTLIRAGNDKKTNVSMSSLLTELEDSKQLSKVQQQENKAKLQAQKLEALGQLTGGIAHDFNNILAAITGYAELSQMTLRTGVNNEKLGSNLKEIIKAGNRAKVLVSQMLTFSRGKDIKAEVIEPLSVLQETLQMMHAILPTSIKLETDYTDFDSRIKIDPVQLQQVLINLVVNARDAIHHSQGKITIGCHLLTNYNDHCMSCNNSFSGDYLCVSVSDNGQGISHEQLNKIFDPFFTTKSVGKGTGMGLSVVHGILHGVNGHIIIESTRNVGSSVKLLLAVTDEPLKVTKPSPKTTNDEFIENIETNKRIMVVDDEVPITQLYEDVFEAEGIETVIFNSSKLALDYFLQHQDDIAVIITDYTMPELNGADFIRAIRRKNDQVPVILCSGNADILDREIFDEIGVTRFLAKPVNLMEISKLVSSFL